MKRVDFDDLVDTYFSAAKWENAVPELRDYHVTKRAIFEDLFDCTLREPYGPHDFSNWREKRAALRLKGIAHACLEQSAALRRPFNMYLEGRPGPMEAMLRDEYERTFDACSAGLSGQYRSMFRHAFGALFPKATTLSFSWATVFERGLSKVAPDPDDFW